jgi:hypothetical protein
MLLQTAVQRTPRQSEETVKFGTFWHFEQQPAILILTAFDRHSHIAGQDATTGY